MKNEKSELCLNEKENNELISAIEETKQGKEEGFKKLYDSTYKFVYSRAKMLCGSEQETSDIVQEVYISVYRGINTLKSNDSLFSWLKTIIFHTGGRIMKKKGNEILLSEESEEAFESLPDETEQTEQNFIDKQDIEIIRSCIDKLSDEQRAVILAYYYDNLKVEEIAELLSISVGTVKSRLFSARKKLKEYIQEEENKHGYKLHSFGATSLVFTLKSILQGNMEASKDKGTLLYNSICKKLKFHSENWIANALAKSNKTLKSRYKNLKMKVLTKAADMGSKKIILSTVAAITAVGVISGTIAIVISNFNNDSITNHISTDSTVVEPSLEEIVSSETAFSSDDANSSASSEISSSPTSTSNKSESTSIPTTSTSKNETASTTQNKNDNSTSTNKYLNHTELTLYTGEDIYSGTEYVGQSYTDYGDYVIDLHLYGLSNSEKITWTSDNGNIASVNSNGEISINSPGITYINAKVGNENFKCKVTVKEIRIYFLREYTDTTIANNYRWIWDGSFCAIKGSTIRYKILERTYDTAGKFVNEIDITSKTDIKPAIDNIFTVNKTTGTIKFLTDKTSQYDLTSDIKFKLTSFDRYSTNSANSSKKSVQWLIMKMFASPQGTFKEKLEVYPNDCVLNSGTVETINIRPKDYTVSFAYDETPSSQPDWFYCTANPNDFIWTSSNDSIVKIKNTYGSSEMHYDVDSAGRVSNIRYSNSYDSGEWAAIYNRAEIVGVGTGTATISVKYMDYEIGTITVTVK